MVVHEGRNWTLHVGEVREVLRSLPAESVHCVVTSPPYWGLRDYGIEGQIGLEPTPQLFVEHMVEVFREVRRVVRADGTVWLNLGDSYTSGGRRNRDPGQSKIHPAYEEAFKEGGRPDTPPGLKPKDLVGIPWRVAFALQDDGWYLRSDIVWAKPNPMPESVTDRPTKAHEYVFLLTKTPRYFFDAEAVKEAATYGGEQMGVCRGTKRRATAMGLKPSGNEKPGSDVTIPAGRNIRTVWTIPTQPYPDAHFATFPEELPARCIKAGTSERGCCPECGDPWERVVEHDYRKHRPSAGNDPRSRNEDKQAKGSLGGHHGWKGNNLLKSVQTTGWRPTCDCWRKVITDENCTWPCFSHGWLAANGEKGNVLPVPCTVLDPFAGSGTTLKIAVELGRIGLGIELSPEYAEMAEKRIRNPKKYAAAGQKRIESLHGQRELFG